MIKSIHTTTTIVANTEVLAVVIAGTPDKKRRIKEIWFSQRAGEVLRGYIDQERVVDVPNTVNQADFQPVPVDYELADGEEFRVGILDEGGAGGDTEIVTFIEES